MCTFQEIGIPFLYMQVLLCIQTSEKFVFEYILWKVVLIILLVLRVFVSILSLWPLSLTCAEAPKPHVNSDSEGLWDSGNCCLSVQGNERLSCNGPPVASVCKLLWAAAVWASPLSCTSLWYFGWLLDFGGSSSSGGYHCFCQGESVFLLHTVAEIRHQHPWIKLHLCCWVSKSPLRFSEPKRLIVSL